MVWKARNFFEISLILTIFVSFSAFLSGCGPKIKNANYGKIDPGRINLDAESNPRKGKSSSNKKTVDFAKKYKPLDPKANYHSFVEFKDPKVKIISGNVNFEFKAFTKNNEEKTIFLVGTLNERGDAFLTSERDVYIKGFLSCVDMESCSELYIDIFVFPNIKRLRQFVVSSPIKKEEKPIPVEGKDVIKEAPRIEAQNGKDLVAVIDANYDDDFEHGNGEPGEFVGRSFSKDLWDDVPASKTQDGEQPVQVQEPQGEAQGDSIANEKNQSKTEKTQPSSLSSEKDLKKQTSDTKVESDTTETEPPKEETNVASESQGASSQLEDISQSYLYETDGGVSIGTTNAGSLVNGTKINASGPGYVSIRVLNGYHDKTHGSGLLIDFIAKQSQHFNSVFPEETIYVNALSAKKGGKVNGHKSHQNGLDADVSYLPGPVWNFNSVLVDSKNTPVTLNSKKCRDNVTVSKDFDIQKNFTFIKKLTESDLVLRIFVNCEIKEAMCKWAKSQGESFFEENKRVLYHLWPEKRHEDHMHVRLKCPDEYEECRNKNSTELPPNPGC